MTDQQFEMLNKFEIPEPYHQYFCNKAREICRNIHGGTNSTEILVLSMLETLIYNFMSSVSIALGDEAS